MSKKEIHLQDLILYLDNVYISLNLNFLKKVLIDASGFKKPHLSEEFANVIGCRFNDKGKFCSSIQEWIKGKRNPPLHKIKVILTLTDFSWEEVEKNLIGMKYGKHGSWVYVRFPITIDNNFGSIVGHILGDGSIDKKTKTIFYSNSNIDLLNEFIECMKKEFRIEPRIWLQKEPIFGGTEWDKRLKSLKEVIPKRNVGLFYPRICSIVLFVLFGIFANGKEKTITKEILNSNKEFKKYLIRAFTDSEGSIKDREIRIHQDDKELLENICIILRELGILPSEIKNYIKRNKLRHYISITGFYNYKKYVVDIGFASKSKLIKIEKQIKNVYKNKSFRLKLGEPRENIKKILKDSKLKTNEISDLMRNKFQDFKWDNTTIMEHLTKLEKEGQVQKVKVNNRYYLWNLINQ